MDSAFLVPVTVPDTHSVVLYCTDIYSDIQFSWYCKQKAAVP